MKIYAISDIHIDYEQNKLWLFNLSKCDYKEDIIIVAGDISSNIKLLEKAFVLLNKCFKAVFFVPGNHELWVINNDVEDSLIKLAEINKIAKEIGIYMEAHNYENVSIVPITRKEIMIKLMFNVRNELSDQEKIKKVLRIIIIIIFLAALVIMKFPPYGESTLKSNYNGAGMLDMKPYYSVEFAEQMFDELGDSGRYFYSRLLIVDLFFIFSFIFVHMRILKRYMFKLLKLSMQFKYQIIYCLVYARACFDIIEDILLLICLNGYPVRSE